MALYYTNPFIIIIIIITITIIIIYLSLSPYFTSKQTGKRSWKQYLAKTVEGDEIH